MADGDEAFTAYVVARREHLRRVAYLLCGDHATAEDLVQTTLTKLYLAWPRVSRMDAPEAYARRVLVTSHIDLTRKPWWSRERSMSDAMPERAVDAGLGAEERDGLLAAVGQLPPSMRRIVVMRHLWGYGVRETAEVLRCSEGTVKSQTAAALERLGRLVVAPVSTKGEAR